MKRVLIGLVVCLLASCGDKSVSTVQPVVLPASSPASAPPPPAVDPEVVIVTPGGGDGWKEVWQWKWDAPPQVGGWVRHTQLKCGPDKADADLPPEGYFYGSFLWSVYGQVGVMEAKNGKLQFNADPALGALLSHQTFPVDQPLRLAATVALQPDPGAWTGLTLIADENDYREISVNTNWEGKGIDVSVYAPCWMEKILTVPAGTTLALALEYTPPPAEICWKYLVDGKVWFTERCDHRNSPLRNPARPGIYVVNLLLEGRQPGGTNVRAEWGQLSISERHPQ